MYSISQQFNKHHLGKWIHGLWNIDHHGMYWYWMRGNTNYDQNSEYPLITPSAPRMG